MTILKVRIFEHNLACEMSAVVWQMFGFAHISHASKVMLKILQVRLQQYVTGELLIYKLGFKEAEEPGIKLPIFVGSWRKQGSSRKTSTLVHRPG